MTRPTPSLRRIEDLKVSFDTDDGVVKAVDGVSFEVARARCSGSSASRVRQERRQP